MRSLIFAFFLSSLKTIPSVIMERKLDFHKLLFRKLPKTVGLWSSSTIGMDKALE